MLACFDVLVGSLNNERDVAILFTEDPEHWVEYSPNPPAFLTESGWYRKDSSTGELMGANCLAGALLGFHWYDHDQIIMLALDGPGVPMEAFFANEDLAQWWSKYIDIELVKSACAEQGVTELSFVVLLGEDYLTKLPRGKRAAVGDEGFVMYLGNIPDTRPKRPRLRE
jgi:hypothetical protein